MRALFFVVLFFFLMIAPFASALPDAPALIWFTGNENPPFDNDGIFTVNWDPVINEEIIRYNIYLTNAEGGLPILVGSNTTPTTFLFSGYGGGNFTFTVSAVNTLGEEGYGATSDWVVIYTAKPVISFSVPTPENNAYTKENWTTISGMVLDGFLDTTIVNWNGADNIYRHPSGLLWMYTFEMPTPGKYTYYVWANNSATNFIKSEVRSITYDVVKPSVSLISPKQDGIYDSVSIPLEYTASDAAPITCKYEYNSINTTLFGCKNETFLPKYGNRTNITIWVTDAAGNINSVSAIFTANTPAAPRINSTVPENNKVLDAPLMTGKFDYVISIMPDRPAQCKYSTAPNTTFYSMGGFFIDGGNGALNTTIPIADKTEYFIYIRCKSADGVMNSEDHLLKFSTAAPEGVLVLDPNGTVIKNNVISMEGILNRPIHFEIPAKTRAAYNITGFSSSASGDFSALVRVNFPQALSNNALKNITVDLIPDKTGSFKTNITMFNGIYSYVLLADIVVYDDFFSEMGLREGEFLNISERLGVLQSKNRDVSKTMSDFEEIQSKMNESRFLYLNNYPVEARKIYLSLNDSLNALYKDIEQAENVRIEVTDNVTDTGESGTSGIGGISITTIVIVIIILIVIVIIATSYVPDEETPPANTANPPAPQEPV